MARRIRLEREYAERTAPPRPAAEIIPIPLAMPGVFLPPQPQDREAV